LAFDHHLGRDAGVVGAGDPDGGVAGHAVPAGENVHLGVLEHVADVEAAGDVGWGEELDEGVRNGVAGGGGGDVEDMLVDPEFGPLFFDEGGVVGLG
jgi:hypothetical protein